MSQSTYTLQDAVNHVLSLMLGQPLAGVLQSITGSATEPALTIGNIVKATIQQPPFAWPWNRSTLRFPLVPGTQAYPQAISTFGWLEEANVSVGCKVTNTLLASNVAAYTAANSFTAGEPVTIFGTTNGDGIFNVNAQPVLASGLSSAGFSIAIQGDDVDSAADAGVAIDPASIDPLEVKTLLGDSLKAAKPKWISPQTDDDNGNITFQVQPAPDQAYLVSLRYQNAPTPFAALTDTWAPMPDARMMHVYMAGFKALCFEMDKDERTGLEMQTFARNLVSMSQGLSETEKAIFYSDFLSKMRAQNVELGLPPAKSR
jgi:hypothetical protein